MKKKHILLTSIVVVLVAVVAIALALPAKSPFGFVPDDADVIFMPKKGWEVYVFKGDPNGIMPEVITELTGLGFTDKVPSPSHKAVRCFSKTYTDGSVHNIEIYNKKLGSAGEEASAEGWISVISHDDHYYNRRIERLISKIKRRISRKSNKW